MFVRNSRNLIYVCGLRSNSELCMQFLMCYSPGWRVCCTTGEKDIYIRNFGEQNDRDRRKASGGFTTGLSMAH